MTEASASVCLILATALYPVVRKPISLIQYQRKLLFHVFNVLVKVSFAYFCFSRLTSFNVKFYRISALNSILGVDNKTPLLIFNLRLALIGF